MDIVTSLYSTVMLIGQWTTMCTEYFITKTVGGEPKHETIIDECDKKPASGTFKDCPDYKYIPSGSSRQRKGLPSWAKK